MLKFIGGHIEIIISLIALSLSFLTYIRNRIRYHYQFASNCYIPEMIVLSDEEDITEARAYPDCIVTNFQFINLSNFDIGFFNLIAYDETNQKHLEILTLNSISYLDQHKQPLEIISDFKESVRYRHLQLPKYKYGTFSSKSMTYLDIVVFPSDSTKSITLEFKLPKRRFFSSKFKSINDTFIKCTMRYDISGWKDMQKIDLKDK